MEQIDDTRVDAPPSIRDWLEDQGTASGKKVDALIESLEAGLGAVLGTTAVREAERDARIRTGARSAIARSLDALGLPTKK